MIDESIKAIKRALDIHKAPTGAIYGHKFLNHIKALLDEVERLREQNEVMRDVINDNDIYYCPMCLAHGKDTDIINDWTTESGNVIFCCDYCGEEIDEMIAFDVEIYIKAKQALDEVKR